MKTVMKALKPSLMVKDIKKTVDFYIDILWFELMMAVPDTKDKMLDKISDENNLVFAMVKNWEAEIMFHEENDLKKSLHVLDNVDVWSSAILYIQVTEIDNLCKSIKDDVEIVKELTNMWYGMREFHIKDNNWYIIGFTAEL